MTITPEMRAVADALLTWTGTSRFGASDVLIWWQNEAKGQVRVALRGEALKIERSVLEQDRSMMPNRPVGYGRNQHGGYLDQDLQRVLGIEIGQTMDTPDVWYQTVLEAVQTCVSAKLGEDTHDVTATLMPNEGTPWVPGSKETAYYSAKKRKVLVGLPPSWVIQGEWREQGENEKGLVADVCSLVAALDETRTGSAVIGRIKGVEFFSTHSFDPTARGGADKVIESIRKCGGLLFPSLAVGHLPASIFGLISLFTDVRLSLLSVKPYKEGRGRYPVVLYGHDTWTDTTAHFLGTFARDLFLQLTGNDDTDMRHMAVLGPALSSGGPVDTENALVATTSKLATALVKRSKVWNQRVTDVKVPTDQYWNQPERYPYLEAKVHARLPLSKFQLATAPASMKESALKFLRAIDYHGPLALVDTTGIDMGSIAQRGDDNATYRYSWRVREAVLALAEQNPKMIVDIIT